MKLFFQYFLNSNSLFSFKPIKCLFIQWSNYGHERGGKPRHFTRTFHMSDPISWEVWLTCSTQKQCGCKNVITSFQRTWAVSIVTFSARLIWICDVSFIWFKAAGFIWSLWFISSVFSPQALLFCVKLPNIADLMDSVPVTIKIRLLSIQACICVDSYAVQESTGTWC